MMRLRDSIYRFTLDIHNETPQVQIAAKRGDSLRQVQMTLTERGKPYFLEPGERAMMIIRTPSETTLMSECEIRSDGTICYDFVRETAKDEGIYECEVAVYNTDDEQMFSPRFTILVADNIFEDGAKLAAREFSEDLAEAQAAIEALQAAQEEDDRFETDVKSQLDSLAGDVENAKDAYMVTAQYNFESDYVITVDKEPTEWVLDGSKRFVLRLTDGNRTIDMVKLVGGESVYKRWMLAGIRPTGQIAGMPYTIGGDTAQQPDYIYAPMGIDTVAHNSSNCMYVKAIGGGKWFWISKPHVSASLSGIAHDVFAPPSTLSGYNTASTYNTGDVVIYSGKVYRCTANSVTGAWDATKWVEQATVYTYWPADYAFLTITDSTAESAYSKNLNNLPVHTVSYIDPSWFTTGVTGLASGYYYVCTTGVKSSGYLMQLAYGPVNGRLYVRTWVPNAEETNGGHYGDWTQLCDTDLDKQGVPAESKAVGDKIAGLLSAIYGSRNAETNTPLVLTSFSGMSSLTKLDDMPDWTIGGILGSAFKSIQPSFPDAGEIEDDYTYYIEKRGVGSTGRTHQYLMYRTTRETIWSGYTSASDMAVPQTVNWKKLIHENEALTWWNDLQDAYIDEMPKNSIMRITGLQFKTLQPDFPDAGLLVDTTSYYLERHDSRINQYVVMYSLYRSPRTEMWTGYTSASDHSTHPTIYWNRVNAPDGKTPAYIAIGASTTKGVVKHFTGTATTYSANNYPDYVGKALRLETHNLAVGSTGFLWRNDSGTGQNFMDVIWSGRPAIGDNAAGANADLFARAEAISIVFGYGNDGNGPLPIGKYDDYYPYDEDGYHPTGGGTADITTMLNKGATLFGCLNWCIRFLNTYCPKAQLVVVFAAPAQNEERTVTQSANSAYNPGQSNVGVSPIKLSFADPYVVTATGTNKKIWEIGQELPKLQRALSIPIIDTYNDAGNAFSYYQTFAKAADGSYALFSTTGTESDESSWTWNRHPNDAGYQMYARYMAGLIARQFLH